MVPNTTVTSRALTQDSPPASEALLLLNDPGSGNSGSPVSQIVCDAASNRTVGCPPNANVFQGEVSGPNQVTFRNIPFNSPPSTVFVLRITGLRIDATALSSPAVVQAIVAASTLAITNEQAIVGFVVDAFATQALTPDLSAPVPNGGVSINACGPVNQPLAVNPSSPTAPDGVSFVVQLGEANNFASAFKLLTDPTAPGAAFAPDVTTRPVPVAQNIPGTIYLSETGFYNPAFPTTGGLNTAGLATSATRFLVRFSGIPAGVQINAPVYENGKGLTDSRVRLVSADSNGASLDYTPLGPLSTLNTYFTPGMIYTYEVTAIQNGVNWFTVDTIDLPFYVAYAGPVSLPVAAAQIQVNVSMGPISDDATPNGIYVPRFKDVSVPISVVNFSGCAGTPSSITLSTSANPAMYGQPVTFTATVTAGATGTVTFSRNGAALGAPVAISGGQAQFTTSGLAAGAFTVTAVYSGDGTFLGSSNSMGQTVTSPQNNRSFVSTTGSDANNCTANSQCRTLAQALAVTNPGGEIVIVDSGGYGPVTIFQPVVITATGVDASITATSGNALTINTAGNVTITGLNLIGGGTGNDGILVQSVGFLRLYNVQIQDFASNGIEFTAAGNLAIYDSKINDSGQAGLLLNNASANAYVHNTEFDNNALAGAISVSGNMSVADSSAHYNPVGFWANGGTVALDNDGATFNGVGLEAANSGTLSFKNCLISDNTTAWSVTTGGAMIDTNPGTSLITPGQNTVGSLASATVLQ